MSVYDGTETGAGVILSVTEIEEALNELADEHGWEWGLELAGGRIYAWSAELRITKNPGRPDGPDRSVVFFSAGHEGPDDGANAVFADALAWLAERSKEARR
jgi:hypothetical protein